MGKKDEPEKQACSGCNGEGGQWVVPNGNGFKKRTWVNCTLCNGEKYV